MGWKALRSDLYLPRFVPSSCRYRLRHEPLDMLVGLIQEQLNTMRIDGPGAECSTTGLDSGILEVASTLFSPSEFEKPRPVIVGNVT